MTDPSIQMCDYYRSNLEVIHITNSIIIIPQSYMMQIILFYDNLLVVVVVVLIGVVVIVVTVSSDWQRDICYQVGGFHVCFVFVLTYISIS